MLLDSAGPELLEIKRVLISVYEKAGVVDLAAPLAGIPRGQVLLEPGMDGLAERGFVGAVTEVHDA